MLLGPIVPAIASGVIALVWWPVISCVLDGKLYQENQCLISKVEVTQTTCAFTIHPVNKTHSIETHTISPRWCYLYLLDSTLDSWNNGLNLRLDRYNNNLRRWIIWFLILSVFSASWVLGPYCYCISRLSDEIDDEGQNHYWWLVQRASCSLLFEE